MDWTYYLSIVVCFLVFCIFAWYKPGWGLCLMPLAIIIAIVVGAAVNDIFPIGFAIVLFPLTIIIVRFTPSVGSLETPWYKAVSGFILTIVKYLLILAVFVAVFQFFSPILFMLFLVATYQFTRAQKFGLAMDVISTIGTSMRQSLPLPMALTTAAYGQKKKEARIFNNIAHWLTQGCPLSEAMRRGYPRCPSHIIGAIATAEKMDQLPRAIESLQADLSEKVNDYKTAKPVHPWYPFVVLTVVFTIMMGLSIFIVPTFSEVLLDMSDGQAHLPAATQSLLNFSSWLIGRKGLNAIMILLVALCVTLFIFYIRFRRRTPEKPRFLSRLGDRIKWHTPVLHWFEKTFGNLYLVQTLRTGLTAGYPVNTILRNALGLDVNRCYQKRIERWLKKIESGDNIAQSARDCRLDETLAWAMDDTVNRGNVPQILEGLEEVYRNQYNYRKNVLSAASWPLVVLGLGLTVGYVVYAMFIGVFSTITVSLQYTIPH